LNEKAGSLHTHLIIGATIKTPRNIHGYSLLPLPEWIGTTDWLSRP